MKDVDMDVQRKDRSDSEHVNVIRTSRVLSPERTWPDRWLELSEMHERRGLAWVRQYSTLKESFKKKA